MDTTGVGVALRRCEEELRKFAADAAAQGDYDLLTRLGTTARTISEIARDWQSGSNAQGDSTGTSEISRPSMEPSETAKAGGRNRTAGRGYPRFMRRGDELVKIGWSKSDRKEYQHRAPHSLLIALRHALLDASKRRKLFTMDTLERQLVKNGTPGYQAYVWLAWLRAAGLVKQHGRQGYSLVKAASFEKDVEKAFADVQIQEL